MSRKLRDEARGEVEGEPFGSTPVMTHRCVRFPRTIKISIMYNFKRRTTEIIIGSAWYTQVSGAAHPPPLAVTPHIAFAIIPFASNNEREALRLPRVLTRQ